MWRLAAPAGASVALSAGIAAARGEIVLAIEAGEQHAAEHIPQLLYQLSRSDLVYVRPRLGGWRKFRHRLARIPRAPVFGLEVRQPERLFWAALCGAIAGISLGRGMLRYLPWLVVRRISRRRHGSRRHGVRAADPRRLAKSVELVRRLVGLPPLERPCPRADRHPRAVGRRRQRRADRAAAEVLLVDPRAPAVLRAGRLAKHPAPVIGPPQSDIRYYAPHAVPAPVHSKAA